MVPWRRGNVSEPNSGVPCVQPAQNLHVCTKAVRKPAFWPPGGPDGLRTGLLAAQTTSRRAPEPQDGLPVRRPPDGPPGAPDGLRTGFLSPQTASGQFSWRPTSGRASWRPRRPPDGPLGAKRAFHAYAFLSVLPRLHDDFLDETSARSTRLQTNVAACRLASSMYMDGVTLHQAVAQFACQHQRLV